MTSYLVTIAADHHLNCLKICARDERTATPGADVLSSMKKKEEKPYGVWDPPPPHVLARFKFKPK